MVITRQGTERAVVLTSPQLLAPELGQVIYSDTTALSWNAFDGAEAYWLEIARDAESDAARIKGAPATTPLSRLDETRAARHPVLSWKPPGDSAGR